jgi:predicted SprT family Zn-dependent metalloprotease
MTRCDHQFVFRKKQGDKYLYKCSVCPEERLLSRGDESLKNQKKVDEKINEDFVCNKCGETFHKLDTAEGPDGKRYCLEHAWFLEPFER